MKATTQRVARGRTGAAPGGGKGPQLGYDLLRLAAITCVALQHVLSVSGLRSATALGFLNLGQTGVTLFCALSGYFALRPGVEPPLLWLKRRLIRVYLPYWIALAAVMTANLIVGYKPVSPGLVASQFLGVGYFTHGDDQVGVHYWFIALILACYGVAALLRARPACLPAAALVAAALLPWDPGFVRHVLSFLVGAAVVASGRPAPLVAGAAALACLALCVAWRPEFAYPFVGALALGAGSFAGTSPAPLAATSRGVYEFYLVHGPIYLGLARFGGVPLAANLLVGTALSVAAAYVLQRAEAGVLGAPGALRHKWPARRAPGGPPA